MKMFRWLAAGAVVILLAALVLWRTSSPQRTALLPISENKTVGLQSAVVSAPANAVAARPQTTGVAKSRDALSVFEDWARKYATASATERAVMMADGEIFARERRREMAQLI